MVVVVMRYVTQRANRKGKLRWYWQRKGFPLKRLSDDAVKRFAEQARWNAEADAVKNGAVGAQAFGTIAWLIKEYEAAERFTKKAESTRRVYGVWLRWFDQAWGALQWSSLDKGMIRRFAESESARPASRELALAVLNNLAKFAVYRDIAATNIMRDLGLELEASPSRTAIWAPSQVDELLSVAARHPEGAALVLGLKLMIYTAQRPSDCLSMTWARWSPDGVDVRQQKTREYLRIWCHRDLAAALRVAKVTARSLRIVADIEGKPIILERFRDWFDKVCADAQIEGMQLRDLRRTAVVRMAEAGCTVPQIAAVSGHSIDDTNAILEVYLPRTPEVAKAAILQLERAGNARV